jgi:hypothetical protein
MVNDMSINAILRAEFAGNISSSKFAKLTKAAQPSDQNGDTK